MARPSAQGQAIVANHALQATEVTPGTDHHLALGRRQALPSLGLLKENVQGHGGGDDRVLEIVHQHGSQVLAQLLGLTQFLASHVLALSGMTPEHVKRSRDKNQEGLNET